MSRVTGWMTAAALAASTAFAAPPTPPQPPAHPRMPGMAAQLAAALGLSDDQKAQLETMQKEQMESARPLFEKQRTLEREMETLLAAPSPDPATVGKKA